MYLLDKLTFPTTNGISPKFNLKCWWELDGEERVWPPLFDWLSSADLLRFKLHVFLEDVFKHDFAYTKLAVESNSTEFCLVLFDNLWLLNFLEHDFD